MTNLGRVLAFVDKAGDEGVILATDGIFSDEVQMGGRFLEDHDVSRAPPANTCDGSFGLLVFEGWIENTGEPEPDFYWAGQWRRPTHWEMCRLRAGLAPWEKSTP